MVDKKQPPKRKTNAEKTIKHVDTAYGLLRPTYEEYLKQQSKKQGK